MSFSLLALTLLLAQADTNAPPATPPAPPAPLPAVQASSAIPDLKEIAPGILEYHGVQLDKKNHRISFPAVVNMHQDLIEYALVNGKGKTHESLLKTNLMPHDIHLAMLLIGYKEDPKANSKEQVPPTAIDPSYLESAPKLKGTPVRLTVAWTVDGKKKESPLEEWIFNLQTNKPMTLDAWTYNGSMIEDGVFLADQELSLFAVVTDPTALVNNPRQGYNNDEIWQVREDIVPPVDTPVVVTITLATPSTSTPPKP